MQSSKTHKIADTMHTHDAGGVGGAGAAAAGVADENVATTMKHNNLGLHQVAMNDIVDVHFFILSTFNRWWSAKDVLTAWNETVDIWIWLRQIKTKHKKKGNLK